MKQEIEVWVSESIRRYAQAHNAEIPSPFEVEINISKDTTHGDLACNAAMKLARIFRKSPKDLANDLVSALNIDKHPAVSRLEVGGVGFINIYLTKNSLNDILNRIIKEGSEYGQTSAGKGKKVLVEFVSANPTGPLTIAHGRQAVVGDAIVRILRKAGFLVSAEYYLNDSGRQMNLLGASLWARYQQALGRDVNLPEDGYQGQYLADIARLMLDQGKSEGELSPHPEESCREFAKNHIMQGIRNDLERVRVAFDHYFSEKTLYDNGELDKAFDDLKARGYLFDEDGALWFRSTDFGDDKDRVVRKSSGEFTYLAPDIAYHRNKFKRGYEWLIDLMGPDHHGYVARLKASCQALGYNPDHLSVRIVQLTTLYRKGQPVRMSTRAGEFVTLSELIDEVGTDATRFFFIMRKVDSHLDFDLDLATEKSQENPVYYLQYAHARICSILKNADRTVNHSAEISRLNTDEETALIKNLTEFPEVIITSAERLEPYRIADYLRDLAALFHKFYARHRVLSDDGALTDARLLLIAATRTVLRNGLDLLGISQPESM